jgi:hypothetical protein
VPAEEAQDWLLHLDVEASERGGPFFGLSRHDPSETNGNVCVHLGPGDSPPRVEIVWGKPRGGALRVRARSAGGFGETGIDLARDLMDRVNSRLRSRQRLRAHRRALLEYEFLPWRGELFLDANLRLGPPSKYPEALLDPQVVVVDMHVEGIGHRGIDDNHAVRLYELRLFLSVVLGITFCVQRPKPGWTCAFNIEEGVLVCKSEQVGYVETGYPLGFPEVGTSGPIQRRSVLRPGLGPYGIDSDAVWIPDDIRVFGGLFFSSHPT